MCHIHLGLLVLYFPPFVSWALNQPLHLLIFSCSLFFNDFFSQPCPLQNPSVTMVMWGPVTALTGAVRCFQKMCYRTLLNNLQNIKETLCFLFPSSWDGHGDKLWQWADHASGCYMILHKWLVWNSWKWWSEYCQASVIHVGLWILFKHNQTEHR